MVEQARLVRVGRRAQLAQLRTSDADLALEVLLAASGERDEASASEQEEAEQGEGEDAPLVVVAQALVVRGVQLGLLIGDLVLDQVVHLLRGGVDRQPPEPEWAEQEERER